MYSSFTVKLNSLFNKVNMQTEANIIPDKAFVKHSSTLRLVRGFSSVCAAPMSYELTAHNSEDQIH